MAIVSEAFARSYFPGENALGKRIRHFESEPYAEIVGIVADSKYGSIGEAPTPLYYSAYTQRRTCRHSSDRWLSMFARRDPRSH